MLRDLLHWVKPVRLISPVSGAADNTATVSQIIDMQGYTGCLIVLAFGSIADVDATFTVLLEEGDVSNLSDAAAVADSSMISATYGTAPEAAATPLFSDDDTVKYLDYVGGKRYIRLTITPAANSGAWLHSGVAIKYGARHNPAGVTQAP